MRTFASDNYAGVHPEVLAALAEANADHAVSYGDDPWTARAHRLLRDAFDAPEAQPWLVFNGTAANTLALTSMCRSFHAAIVPQSSHLNVDEAGAPEHVAGVKLLPVVTTDGKLRPADLPPLLGRRGDPHAVQPHVVSIANASELGTVYTVAETRALAEAAHEHGMLLHVDGARLANAAAGHAASLADLTTHAGVDVVSFGLTKNGALGVEAVMFLRPPHDPGVAWLRKQQSQLASKMRFLAAQVVALMSDGLWRRSAAHANAMARDLAAGAEKVSGVTLTQRVQSNAIFATLPRDVAEELRGRFPFYTWDRESGEVRWMCSWDTTPEDVASFLAALREVAKARVTATT
jgi:threonine aldolase